MRKSEESKQSHPSPPWWRYQRVNGWEGRELLDPELALDPACAERAIRRFYESLKPARSRQKELFGRD